MSNSFRATCAKPGGTVVGTVEPELGTVSWALSGIGRATLRMKTTDPKWNRDFFGDGRLILFEFANKLPNWGGVISQRNWLGNNLVEVVYRSGEALAEKRLSGKNEVYSLKPGAAARALLLQANAYAPTGLDVGDFWTGGETISTEYHYNILSRALADIRTKGGGDWYVSASRVGAKLVFKLNYVERLGKDKTGVGLKEGGNFSLNRYSENAEGAPNEWFVSGGGSDWGGSRLVGTARDATNIGQTGLRQASLILNSVTDQTTLDAAASTQLTANLKPRPLTGDAIDLLPGLFADYHVGDRVMVESHNAGFDGVRELGRVLTREYRASDGICAVSLELDT